MSVKNESVKATEQTAYKRLNELSLDEIRSLKTVAFGLYRKETKSGSVFYTFSCRFPGLEINDQVSSVKYQQLSLAFRHLTDEPLKKQCNYRLIKGIDKNGQDFYQLQFAFAPTISFTHILSQAEFKNYSTALSIGDKKVEFIVKPQDVAENLTDDDFAKVDIVR